jgi:hypothetical protein
MAASGNDSCPINTRGKARQNLHRVSESHRLQAMLAPQVSHEDMRYVHADQRGKDRSVCPVRRGFELVLRSTATS